MPEKKNDITLFRQITASNKHHDAIFLSTALEFPGLSREKVTTPKNGEKA